MNFPGSVAGLSLSVVGSAVLSVTLYDPVMMLCQRRNQLWQR